MNHFYIAQPKGESKPHIMDIFNDEHLNFVSLKNLKTYLFDANAKIEDFDIYLIETNIKKVKPK